MKHIKISFSLAIFLCMIGVKANAHDIAVKNDRGMTIYYVWINNNTELAVSCRGKLYTDYDNEYKGKIHIPETVTYDNKKYKVTAIADNAFRDCSEITHLFLPNSVTTIGKYAFSGSTKLETLPIPNGVVSINDYAFQNCSSLWAISIGTGVTSISSSSFSGCTNLRSFEFYCQTIGSWFSGMTSLSVVFIGNEVASIGSNAFKDCTGLSSITISNGVTSIGEYAFYGCTGLTSIDIPNSMTSIGEYAFDGCTGLTSVTINSNAIASKEYFVSSLSTIFGKQVKEYVFGDDVECIGAYACYHCTGLTSVTIPNSVTSIGNDAFNGCSSLTSVTIPNSVTSIGVQVFTGCKGLTSIDIPNNVTSIGDRAFGSCTGLVSVIIPNSVVSIGEDAFNGCTGLTSITIGSGVISVGEGAFKNCTGLTCVELHCKTIDNWFNYSKESITNVIVGDEVTSIGSYAFEKCIGLTSLTIGNSVASIGYAAFRNCEGLTSVTIGNSMTSIGGAAFEGCTGITSIDIPNSVTSIGTWAFSNCSGLTSVTIPNSVTSIGGAAFEGCTGLTSVTINSNAIATSKTYSGSSSASNLSGIFGGQVKEYIFGDDVESIGAYACNWCSGLTSVTISNSVTSIGDRAFGICKGLTSIDIPNSVTSIGDGAFYKCTGLTSVTIPNSVTSIGEYAFESCTGLKTIDIPSSIMSIGGRTFENCTSMISIDIPNSVTSIGDYAFDSCTGLTSVTIPNSVVSIGKYAFCNCDGLTSVTVGNSVTSIDNRAFYGCTGLTSVEFHCETIGSWFSGMTSLSTVFIRNEVTSIGSNAFKNCTGLSSITIPDGVTSIEESAFEGCTELTSVIIPNLAAWCSISFGSYSSNPLYYAHHLYLDSKEVTDLIIPETVCSVNNYAFYGCTGLSSVTTPSSVTSIGERAFYGCTGITSVSIDNGVIGSQAFYNCSGLIRITLGNGLVSIDNQAFYNCLGLTRVTFGNGLTSIGSRAFSGCTNLSRVSISDVESWCGISFGDATANPLRYAHTLVIGNKVAREIVIPSGVKSVNPYAFYNCSGMTSVSIPNSVTSIGGSAFSDCSALTSVVVPDGVNEIGASAFANCSGLKSVSIGGNVTAIGGYAFNGCTELESVKSFVHTPFSISTNVFSDNVYMSTPLYVPKGCVELYQDADGWFQFDNILENGENGEFTDEVTSIVYRYDIESLTASVKDGKNASGDVVILDTVMYHGYVFSVTSIDDAAFEGCQGVCSLNIPQSITSIGAGAFKDCTGLASVIVRMTTPIVITEDVFTNRANLTLYVPEGSKSAYEAADYWNEFVIIEENAEGGDYTDEKTSIVYHYNIGTLTASVKDGKNVSGDVVIPETITYHGKVYSVKAIDDAAFDGCTDLTFLDIPQSIASIGDGAFKGCTGLTTVVVRMTTPIAITEDVFTNRTNATLYVPTGCKLAYVSADYWNEFMAIKLLVADSLLEEAEALAMDSDAVAVGKLQDAIIAYWGNSDAAILQAAINQFKEDNKDQEKDQTAKVGTGEEWKKFNGTEPAGVCSTQYAPMITTYDGRDANLRENYETTTETIGQIIYQEISGLENGSYKVGFYSNAFYTSGRGFSSTMTNGAQDVAYVFANDQKEFITAKIATSTTENNYRQFNVEVTDGTIKLGLGKEKAGTNWHTIQIYQLTWFTTAKAVYAQDKAEMQATIEKAQALISNEYKTGGREDMSAAIEAAEAALASNKLNIPELETEIAKLKEAIFTFRRANYVTFSGTYYLQNVSTSAYMAAGSTFGTFGIVNNYGLDLTLSANENKSVYIDTNVYYYDTHYLGSNLYMDSYQCGWLIEQMGKDTYSIGNGTKYIGVNDSGDLLLVDNETEWRFITVEEMQEARIAAFNAATADNGVDATFLLNGPNFNRNDKRNEAWTVSENCTNSHLGGGEMTNFCAESFHSVFTISQSISGAPAGIYKMTAQGFYRQDEDLEEPVPQFFIGDAMADVPVKTGDEDNMIDASNSFSKGLYNIDPIEYRYDGEGDLVVGVRNETATNQWVIFDNFRLTYYGPYETTSIDSTVQTANDDYVFDMQGRRIEGALKKGIYIIGGKKKIVK